MITRRELITMCRQIGTMTEVGVDFLRITRALREQSENPRMIELLDQLDYEMKMGESLSEAIAKAPDVFSPFAVSIVRQGEVRGDIEGAWHRLADFYKEEAKEDRELGEDAPEIGAGYIPTRGLPSRGLSVVAPRAPVTVGMLNDLIDRIQNVALRGLTWISGLLICLAAVRGAGSAGWIEPQWLQFIQLCTAATFLGGAGSWLRVSLARDRRRQAQCSFCGKSESEVTVLQRAPRLAGAAICDKCAYNIAPKHEEHSGSQNGVASKAKTAYYDPNQPIVLDADDPLESV